MTTLHVVAVGKDAAADRLIDTITVGGGGQFSYDTGVAESVVLSLLRRDPDANPAELLSGWSNGYVAIRPAPEEPGGVNVVDD